jgi:exodeoxyribonuclease V alpha subunit
MKPKRTRGAVAAQPELALGFTAPAPPPASEPETEKEYGPLDVRFAELLERLNGMPNATLAEAARAVSAARAAGETCLPLHRLGPDVASTRRALRATKVVGAPGEWQPLILDAADRLYLQRYWAYERRLAESIAKRLQAAPPEVDEAFLESELGRVLPGEKSGDQRTAAGLAVRSRFAIITGGPGTGKTRTVGVILSLLRELAARAGQTAPRIALAAPTGKAAMRLQDSIRQIAAENGESPELEAVTIHRLLGLFGDSPKPRFDAARPLLADVVIVDEASMIDLAMMSKLAAAVPEDARLILLGDREQLPPVETGRVFGDLCAARALAKAVATLSRNFRFGEESGLKRLSDAVQRSDCAAVLDALQEGRFDDLRGAETPVPDALRASLQAVVRERTASLLAARHDPEAALAALGTFRILGAMREGPYGVENLNAQVENLLAEAGEVVLGSRHYAGRPVMILRNDYQLRLFNGDVGVLLHDPEAGGDLRAFFRSEDGTVRRLSPARLPEHETAWAMTVHKSQGSEFERILLVLPDRPSPVVTRELIYTAITRARSEATVWYRPEALSAALGRSSERCSGLSDALAALL